LERWSYDTNTNDRRLTATINTGQARSFQYETTPEYHIVEIAESTNGSQQQSWSYTYDAVDRLTNATLSSDGQYTYGYDAAGNIPSIQRRITASTRSPPTTGFSLPTTQTATSCKTTCAPTAGMQRTG
jgi:YD repeat-containing protein